MTVKKIHLGYEAFLLEKINQLERDIVLYQNDLDSLSSGLENNINDPYREELRKLRERRKKVVGSRIEKTREEISKLRTELSQELSKSQYEPILIVERERFILNYLGGSELDYLDGDFNAARWFYIYQDIAYQVSGTHSDEESKLLVLEFVDKERRKFEQLKNKFSGAKSEELKYERLRIPEAVRIAVWRRDQGKCARCGNRENLEYDHIVPVSKGGGNTERNIELLCQNCNRAKSNRIE